MDPLRKPTIKLDLPEAKRQKVLDILDKLTLTDSQMSEVCSVFEKEVNQGLSKDPDERKLSSLQMENTYVRALLNGTEEGDFLALDLGGTNFRVLLCKMRQGKCESLSKNYNVPRDKLYGPAAGVFDHLAESIHKFLTEENMLDKTLPLGFTFSFPMTQHSLKKGVLVTWTKSFANPDGVGQDAVRLLEEALDRRGDVHVDVVAILNDTTGTLLAGSYLDHECGIGLIIGTGSNAAYVEQISNIPKWTSEDEGEAHCQSTEVVIDMESGAFGDNGSLNFIKTEYDSVIDLHSNHVGSFTFEKLFAGHYVGDVARLVLADLTKQGLVLQGKGSVKLFEWNTLTAQQISQIEKDSDASLDHTHAMLSDMGLEGVACSADISVIRYICAALSIRTAQLTCAKLGMLVRRMKRERVTIAMDGSLYRYHPKLEQHMLAWLSHLAPNTKCKLVDALDGSGRGAAFVAAVAVRMANESKVYNQQ